jgi:predicted nucleic acid-binding Zn ribbon protein
METGESSLMVGDKIYRILKEENLSNEHFDMYREYVRKQDFPTEEELHEKREKELLWAKKREEARLNQIEQDKETRRCQQYTQSSYIERLKARHNIAP